MAGTTKDMSLIKQVLQLKQAGESNRGVSRKLPIDKETVNNYVNTVKANGWNIVDLLEIENARVPQSAARIQEEIDKSPITRKPANPV